MLQISFCKFIFISLRMWKGEFIMATTLRTPFNETQMYLLSMFEHNRTKSQLDKLKMAMCEFYFKEVENEVKKACEEKHITVADTDAFAAKNLHTTYK